jgi:hypothetical protein
MKRAERILSGDSSQIRSERYLMLNEINPKPPLYRRVPTVSGKVERTVSCMVDHSQRWKTVAV